MLERVVELRRGHRAGVEPRVEHRLDAARARPFALRAVDGDVVDRGAVEVEVGEVAARALGELGDRADARVGAAVVAAPHRQRGAPEPVARQRPVDVVLQPVAETSVLDVLGVPADGLVLAQERRPCGPTCARTRWAWPSRSAACRSASSAGTSGCSRRRARARPTPPSASMMAGSASFTNVPVHGVLPVGVSTKVAAGPTGLSIGSPSASATSRSISPNAGARCTMPEPSSTVTKSAGDDARPPFGGRRRAGGGRRGARSGGPTRSAAVDRRPRPRRRRPARRRRAPPPPPGRGPRRRPVHAHVVDVGADRGADVGDERPRRGRPHEEVEVAPDDREAHVHRRLGDVAVRAGLAQLVARQRGAAATAVRDDLVALVDVAARPTSGGTATRRSRCRSCRASSRRRRCRATCRCAWSATRSRTT